VTATFRKRFGELPAAIQVQARADYRVLQRDPTHPGLRFHQVSRGKDTLYSVSIGIHYRALAREKDGELYWFWIGHHTVYDAILTGR
jgi:hypothetical protein